MSEAQFVHCAQDLGGPRWLHSNGRHFITFFEAVEGVRAAYFQAYEAKAQPAAGRMPWSVDNRRLGREGYGFPTLEAAMQTCTEVA